MTTTDVSNYMQSREAYDTHVQTWPKDQQWQWWPVPWSLATWSERVVKIGLFFLGAGFVVAGVVVVMVIFGTIVEGIARHNSAHDRCLKNATNGYEIAQCR